MVPADPIVRCRYLSDGFATDSDTLTVTFHGQLLQKVSKVLEPL